MLQVHPNHKPLMCHLNEHNRYFWLRLSSLFSIYHLTLEQKRFIVQLNSIQFYLYNNTSQEVHLSNRRIEDRIILGCLRVLERGDWELVLKGGKQITDKKTVIFQIAMLIKLEAVNKLLFLKQLKKVLWFFLLNNLSYHLWQNWNRHIFLSTFILNCDIKFAR